MRSPEKKFSLSNDPVAALEFLRLQEAAQLANDQHTARQSFQRNDKLSHVVHAFFHLSQFIIALTDEIFHHLHHAINRRMREQKPDIPSMPEERNPIFYVYPICMGLSLILGIVWLTTKTFDRRPIIALYGNALGGILIMIGGISAMRHAEKHINLNEVSDEELLTHPIFIHNFVMCIVSISGMILYFVPTWILFDVYKWKKNLSEEVKRNSPINERRCRCRHSRIYHSSRHKSEMKSLPRSINNSNKNEQNEPIILYCCCVDFYRYLKSSKYPNNLTHEFVVIQVM